MENYYEMKESEYPELIIKLKLNSLATPKTAWFIFKHNYSFVSIYQNNVKYYFNNGEIYDYTF